MLLDGKKALVTGAGGRLGRRLVSLLAEEGATVAALDLPGVLGDGGLDGASFGLSCDVADDDAVAAAVATADERLGGLDVLVNAHGYVPNSPVLEVRVEEWDRTFAVNVRGVMLMCRAVGRLWVERGVRGSMVTLSSGAATSARPGGAHYCGSKAAVNMLVEVLATELGPHGIRVNAVAPGLVLDEVVTEVGGGHHPYVDMMLQATPLRRTGAPEDIAQTVVFLASDRSAWTTGSVFEVTGGSHCGRTHVPLTRDLR
jgi:NAD(P)-dependent dehydrogenase (short-subunit alcohol dehydrogenase family)